MKLSFVLGLLLNSSVSAFQMPLHQRPISSNLQRISNVGPLHAGMYVDVNEQSPRDVQTFDQWATNNGVERAGGLRIDTQDGMDYQAIASEPIPANSMVLKIPNYMVISANRIREELDLREAVDSLGKLGAAAQVNDFSLFVKILVEYEQGDDSSFFPWLNSLPRLYFNAASITSFCYECLPPLVFSLSRTEKVRYDNFKTVLKKVPFVSPQVTSNETVLKWAFNIVTTRSFETNTQDKAIVPMGDMFNHGTDVDVELQYDEQGNAYAVSTTDIPPGKPIHMSYGDPTNPSKLFATYGFLDESSPATFCKIMNITPTPELRDIGLDFSRMLFFKETGEISQEVWDVILYDFLKGDKQAQQGFYQAHMGGDFQTKQQYHQHYLYDTSTILKKHVDDFIATLDTLGQKTAGKDINEHPRIPVILQHNEFVRQTFLTVKNSLDPIVAQAGGQY